MKVRACAVSRCERPADHPWDVLWCGERVVTILVCAGHDSARRRLGAEAHSDCGITYQPF